MQTAREEVYCHETARRAVARAALHLGMENMTSEALSVTADCLLEYLQRIGQALAHSTEASGRSSAHVHVLDAVRAVELCTSPAVERLHLTTEGAAGGAEGTEQEAQVPPMTNWKGLAQFLFGNDWHLEEQTGEEGQASAMARVDAQQRAGGEGKVGPSTVQDDATTAVAAVGWQAPYPDEVPPFPLVAGKVANPHPFTDQEAHVALSRQVVETEATKGDEQTPDAEVGEGWGDLHKTAGDDKKRKAESKNDADEPPTKRVKIAGDDPMSEGEEAPSEEITEVSLYPTFFPPLPRATDGARRLVVDVPSDATAKTATSHPVRSALVALGGESEPTEQQPYWGSGWENLAVPPGRPEDKGVQPQIVPLGRASGSRVSRILEGSMDAAQMQ